MTFYDILLRELFHEFRFYALDGSADEKVFMSYDELSDPKGMNARLQLNMANYMVTLGLADNLVDGMDKLGIELRSSPEGTMTGLETVATDSALPRSLRISLYTHALFAQYGSKYENDYPPKGSEINITGLFTQGAQLVEAYFYQLRTLMELRSEHKQVLQQEASAGNEMAQAVLNEVNNASEQEQAPEPEADKTPAPELSPGHNDKK